METSLKFRRFGVLGGLVILVVVAIWLAGGLVDLDTLIAHERRLVQWIAERPVTSAMLGLVLYILLAVIPGTGGKALVFSWLFGFWVGLVHINVGLTVAAVITFKFSRLCFREAVCNRFPRQVTWLDRMLKRDGPYVVLTLRLANAPYTLTNYTLGATSLRTRTFWWTTQLGMLPSNAVFAYAGSRLPSLDRVAAEGKSVLFAPEIVLAFVLMACVPVLLRVVSKRRSRGANPLDEQGAIAGRNCEERRL